MLEFKAERGQVVVVGDALTGEQLWLKQVPTGLVGQTVSVKDDQPPEGASVGGVTVVLAEVWVMVALATAMLGALQGGGS